MTDTPHHPVRRKALVSAAGAALAGLADACNAQARAAPGAPGAPRDAVSVIDFMSAAQRADVTAKTGAVDVTTAIQAAIDAAGTRSSVEFPAGTYRVTSQLLVSQNRVHLVGAGSWATQILFAPIASGTCMKLSAGSAVLFQGSVRGFAFFSSDSTHTKVALEVVDTSGYLIDDVVVGGSILAVPGSRFWSGGAGSVGILCRGREACRISRVSIYADKPIQISDNPNNSIDIDHFHFQDTYLGATNYPCVTIDSGVNLTNVTFDGYNAWVLGTDGLKWVDTATIGVSQTLILRGVRFEQGKNAAGWCIDIQHNYRLYGLSIEDCQGGLERNGIRLRKVTGTTLRNNINTGGAGRTVLDVDATVQGLDILECFWQVGGSANMAGQVLLWAAPKPASGAPLAPTARYQSSMTADRRTSTQAANGGYLVTVEDGATVGLGPNTTAGMLTVVDSEYLSATFNLRGTNLAVSKVADPSAVYSSTSGSTSMTNVYWSPANARYELQNNRGTERRYLITLVGTYTSF